MQYVVDANIILKWYTNEADSEQALQFRTSLTTGRHIGIIPFLAFVEVANIVTIKHRFKQKQFEIVLNDLAEFPFEVVPYSHALLAQATASAREHNLAVYDGIYLAIAKQLNVKLLTQDGKLALAAPRHSLSLENLN